MEVTRSRYYSWKASQDHSPDDPDSEILQVILKLRKNRRYLCYGSRRLKGLLEALGVIVSRKRVRKIMKKHHIKARQKRSYRPKTTHSSHGLAVAVNILERDFSCCQAYQKWAGDITYLRCGSGFVYLAIVMDLYSRKIIGWSLSRRMPAKLVADALTMAIGMRGRATGAIFHSDRGSQYASNLFRELLYKNNMTASMSRKGDCWDNSPVESFFATLKKEADLHGSMNFKQIQSEVFDYIAVFYNRQRSHSYLNGVSPETFEINNNHINKSA